MKIILTDHAKERMRARLKILDKKEMMLKTEEAWTNGKLLTDAQARREFNKALRVGYELSCEYRKLGKHLFVFSNDVSMIRLVTVINRKRRFVRWRKRKAVR